MKIHSEFFSSTRCSHFLSLIHDDIRWDWAQFQICDSRLEWNDVAKLKYVWNCITSRHNLHYDVGENSVQVAVLRLDNEIMWMFVCRFAVVYAE